jgi:hypothetical protein|tara:strand:+ start:900 stop:1058 length:159 start_codon:yes stop_codon:yes gene_type:complete
MKKNTTTTTTTKNETPAPLPDWMEWVEDRPIVCGLIAAVIGLTGGLIVGANI